MCNQLLSIQTNVELDMCRAAKNQDNSSLHFDSNKVPTDRTSVLQMVQHSLES